MVHVVPGCVDAPLLLAVCLAAVETGVPTGGEQPTPAIAKTSKLKELPKRSKLSMFHRRVAVVKPARTYNEALNTPVDHRSLQDVLPGRIRGRKTRRILLFVAKGVLRSRSRI